MNKRFSLVIAFTLVFTGIAWAGPPPPPPGGSTPTCWPPPCVPIDGGISLLIAAGALYGGSKLYKKAKSKNVNP